MKADKIPDVIPDPVETRRTILVVDDEPSITDLLVRILETQGIEGLECNDSELALEKIKGGGIDLVITDLRMPKMDGLELIRRAREIDGELSFIVITGFSSMETFLDAAHEGISDFILKPIDRKQFLGAVKKVLEKKSLTENLIARTRQLLQAEKMATIGLLSAGVAHEINNPTTFIRTNLQLMGEYIKRMKPRLENLDKTNVESIRNIILNEFPHMIDEALKGTERIQKIVAGIKHYAHMGDEASTEKVDIREVIAQSVNLVRAKIRKNITITENYLNIREIRGQFSKLEQVFVNLLVNAADAIAERMNKVKGEKGSQFSGLIDVSATVIEGGVVDGERTPDYLVLTFYDNGGGIPEEKLDRVFDPFFTTKAVGVGTGLGLYICYEIIKQHGGEITVQSEKGEGTAFIIKLPVEGSSAAKNKAESTAG